MIPKRINIACTLLFWSLVVTAQPAGYYNTAEGLSGLELKQALHDIIDNHNVSTYSDLWTHFQSTDMKTDGSVWDIYSTVTYQFITDQCGDYNSEGDCYNREHSFPKSWFGGEITPMYTDLFHLYPTDGFVNGKRGNLPYGETLNPTWTSSNGSRLGVSSVPGYSGEIFEPIDEYKGDLARTYFYMAVRYYGEDSGWPGSDMVAGAEPEPWALDMLIRWNTDDPVSQKETDRNEAVYDIQGNRNPFIDNDGYVSSIWGVNSYSRAYSEEEALRIYPNPASGIITINLPREIESELIIKILTLQGVTVWSAKYEPGLPVRIDLTSLARGTYLLVAESKESALWQKIILY